ncbi:MAG: DsbA family protein [Nanoarchaeota archaeon]
MNHSDTIKIPKLKIQNYWKLTSIILIILVLILLFKNPFFSRSISGEKAGKDIVDYLNARTNGGVTYNSYKDLGNLYEITVDYQNKKFPVYITKDGSYFIQSLSPIEEDSEETQNTDKKFEVSADDDAILGDPNAEITIIEFSDYQCPFCKKFYDETLPLLKSDYINKGKVKLIYRDYPLSSIHPQAQKAAEAAECAGEQNKYYQYHDKLFKDQKALNIDNLKKYAKELGLNTNDFNNCLDSNKMESEVQKDLEEGLNLGIQGTPAFFINGKPLMGAYPFEEFKKIIEQELSNKK